MDRKEESCSSGVAVLSFLTGTAIGAAVALLLAPRSGRETRAMIKEYGTELTDRAVEEVRGRSEDAVDRGRRMIERGKNLIGRGTELVNQGREFVDEKKKILSAAIDAGREAMQREKENLAKAAVPEEE
ncbi:MAG: YtxH domain-containing protein [Desulfobacteraceae bacterium]|nr:YtxH domain-containing protein [Desulfobacteraceae bacterium]